MGVVLGDGVGVLHSRPSQGRGGGGVPKPKELENDEGWVGGGGVDKAVFW